MLVSELKSGKQYILHINMFEDIVQYQLCDNIHYLHFGIGSFPKMTKRYTTEEIEALNLRSVMTY